MHGFSAEDVEKDHEGLQTMRNLGENIAFMLKAFKAQKEKDGGFPKQDKSARTNFFQ